MRATALPPWARGQARRVRVRADTVPEPARSPRTLTVCRRRADAALSHLVPASTALQGWPQCPPSWKLRLGAASRTRVDRGPRRLGHCGTLRGPDSSFPSPGLHRTKATQWPGPRTRHGLATAPSEATRPVQGHVAGGTGRRRDTDFLERCRPHVNGAASQLRSCNQL